MKSPRYPSNLDVTDSKLDVMLPKSSPHFADGETAELKGPRDKVTQSQLQDTPAHHSALPIPHSIPLHSSPP